MNPDIQSIIAKYKYNPAQAKLPGATVKSNDLASEFDAYIANPQAVEEKQNPSFLNRAAESTGIPGFGKAIGQAIAAPGLAKDLEQSQQQLMDSQSTLMKRIKERKAQGADTTKLEGALAEITKTIQDQGNGAQSLLTNDITDEDIIGDALKLAGTVAGFAKVPGVLTAGSKATTVLGGAAKGAIEGGVSGIVTGALAGSGDAIKTQQDVGAGVGGAVSGGITGGIGGAVLGGVAGAITGGIKGKQLRKQVLDAQITEGQKAPIDLKTGNYMTTDSVTGEQKIKRLNPVQKKAITAAKAQGFDDADTAFLLSMSEQDKKQAARMINISEKSIGDKRTRALVRPEDVLGESFVKKVGGLDTVNADAGKRVDEAARALRGQPVDASAVRQTAVSELENAGVIIQEDGKLNFSNSIFKKTPELSNKIQKAFADLPDGIADAEQVHLFKKSIDQIVEYGKTSGKAFTAKAESLLKGARAAADDVLDANFDAYNAANTDYKVTKEILDELESLFGKKVGITDKRGGQVLRGIFSNNQQRSRLLQILPQIEEVATKYNVNTPDNLVDQAIFVDMLEELYGTQATTSLQGQTERGVRGAIGTTQKVIAGVRDPIKGAGELAAAVAEKMTGISEDKKRAVMRSLLGDLSEKPVRSSGVMPGFLGPKGRLSPESEDVILKALRDLQKKGFKAPADGRQVNLQSFAQLEDLLALSDKGPLKQSELRDAAELLARNGVRLPILKGA